jgi:hypothetical protein
MLHASTSYWLASSAMHAACSSTSYWLASSAMHAACSSTSYWLASSAMHAACSSTSYWLASSAIARSPQPTAFLQSAQPYLIRRSILLENEGHQRVDGDTRIPAGHTHVGGGLRRSYGTAVVRVVRRHAHAQVACQGIPPAADKACPSRLHRTEGKGRHTPSSLHRTESKAKLTPSSLHRTDSMPTAPWSDSKTARPMMRPPTCRAQNRQC